MANDNMSYVTTDSNVMNAICTCYNRSFDVANDNFDRLFDSVANVDFRLKVAGAGLIFTGIGLILMGRQLNILKKQVSELKEQQEKKPKYTDYVKYGPFKNEEED